MPTLRVDSPFRAASCSPKRRLIAAQVAAALPLSLALYQPAQAVSLLDAYQSALDKDPTFQSARYQRDAAGEYEAIGRAALLPSVNASYNVSKNDADRTTTLANGNEQKDNPQYTSKVATIQVRQPLLNLDAWQRYQGSKVQVSYGEAKFAGDMQDLISRLTTAYLDALLAEDQLRLAIAQRDAYRENQISNQNLFEKGAGTRTDVLESRARFELAQAQVLEAEDNVKNKRDALAVIIGRDPGTLDTLVATLPELPMTPATLAEWEGLATANNPEVRSQRYSVDYARTEVERNRAGHYPRIDAVASHSRNNSDSLFTFNQQSTINAIGVQMSLPIYSGGGVTAQTRQAAARLASGQADLDAAMQKALVEVRKQFQLVTSSRIRMGATEQAVKSAEESVEATRKSVAGGQRVNLDVLNALQQLYTAKRDLSEARHGYLQAYLRLHAAGGALNGENLGLVSACFEARP